MPFSKLLALALLIALPSHALTLSPLAAYCTADAVVKGLVRSAELRTGKPENCEGRNEPRTLRDYEEEYGKNCYQIEYIIEVDEIVSRSQRHGHHYLDQDRYVVHFLHADPAEYEIAVADHLRTVKGKTVLAPLLYFGGIFRDEGYEWGLGHVRSVSELDLARSLNEAECKRRIDSGQR